MSIGRPKNYRAKLLISSASLEQLMNLIAYSTQDQDPAVENPYAVYWEDGTDATLFDFHHNTFATHENILDFPGRIARRIYPNVIAGMRWDYDIRDWRVSGTGVIPFYLKLYDVDACDHELQGELQLHPVVYRCVIIRARHVNKFEDCRNAAFPASLAPIPK